MQILEQDRASSTNVKEQMKRGSSSCLVVESLFREAIGRQYCDLEFPSQWTPKAAVYSIQNILNFLLSVKDTRDTMRHAMSEANKKNLRSQDSQFIMFYFYLQMQTAQPNSSRVQDLIGSCQSSHGNQLRSSSSSQSRMSSDPYLDVITKETKTRTRQRFSVSAWIS